MKYGIRSAQLPLAVYREVAAHLCQIDGVRTELQLRSHSPASSSEAPPFDYALSQVDSLWIEHPDYLGAVDRAQLQRILAYYGDRYGAWERLEFCSDSST